MLLLDDPSCEVIEHYTAETAEMELLYDFDLMEQGGTHHRIPYDRGSDVRPGGGFGCAG